MLSVRSTVHHHAREGLTHSQRWPEEGEGRAAGGWRGVVLYVMNVYCSLACCCVLYLLCLLDASLDWGVLLYAVFTQSMHSPTEISCRLTLQSHTHSLTHHASLLISSPHITNVLSPVTSLVLACPSLACMLALAHVQCSLVIQPDLPEGMVQCIGDAIFHSSEHFTLPLHHANCTFLASSWHSIA